MKLLLMSAIVTTSLLSWSCAGEYRLTDIERTKLDVPLQKLLEENREDIRTLDMSVRADGAKQYAVVIRSDNPDEIRKLGVPVSSAFDDVIVARATVGELRTIVALPAVRSVHAGTKRSIE